MTNKSNIFLGVFNYILKLLLINSLLLTYDNFIFSNDSRQGFLAQNQNLIKNNKLKSIVQLEVFPSSIIEMNRFENITVAWSSSPTFIASNSWIGLYKYAQKTSHEVFSHHILNETYEGSCILKVPNEAGIYQVKLVQDNNLHSVAASGPLFINPAESEVYLEVSNLENSFSEKITISWMISESWTQGIKRDKKQTFLCLNLLGLYDDCIWKFSIDHYMGQVKVKLPSFSAFFVVRLMISEKTWKNENDSICIYVSRIIRVKNSNFNLISEKKKSIVGSTVSVKWNVENPSFNDWIGLYSLDNFDVFLHSVSPLSWKKINNSKRGKFEAFLPPNSDSGPFVFIYFSNYQPMSISDPIQVMQPLETCPENNSTQSNIKHLVIICTENHSFDSYFGNYCKAEAFSNPNCTQGPECCEGSPKFVDGHMPVVLNDTQNSKFDPNHSQECEICEMNNGKMDGYIKNCPCSDPQNFAVADEKTVDIIHFYAKKYALADRYFQPSAGSSSQNNMYFARGSYVFKDNTRIASGTVGSICWYMVHHIPDEYSIYYDPSITSLLARCGFKLKTYAEGYRNASLDLNTKKCYPNGYDSSDIPFNYYAGIFDKKKYIADYEDFIGDIKNKTLPEVSYIKPLGIRTGHPGMTNITDEMKFIEEVVENVLRSDYSENTLILWVPDESGGYYDHIPPPSPNEVDNVPYGPRIPMIAIGKFAKKNYISHVTMEHSSILKFIEWNWLDGNTGQLNTRDRNVNNIGDLLDPIQVGRRIPS